MRNGSGDLGVTVHSVAVTVPDAVFVRMPVDVSDKLAVAETKSLTVGEVENDVLSSGVNVPVRSIDVEGAPVSVEVALMDSGVVWVVDTLVLFVRTGEKENEGADDGVTLKVADWERDKDIVCVVVADGVEDTDDDGLVLLVPVLADVGEADGLPVRVGTNDSDDENDTDMVRVALTVAD